MIFLNNDQLFIGNYPLHINKGKDSPLKYVLFFHPSTYTVSQGYHTMVIQFSSVQLLSHVRLFVTPWTAARQASLSISNSRSPPKPMSIELVTPSNHLILCHPLLLLPSIFPSIWVFSNESVLCISWPEYWSFSFSISPSNEYSRLISFKIDWFDLLAVWETLKSLLQHTIWKHQFFGAQLSLKSNSHIHTWPLEKP